MTYIRTRIGQNQGLWRHFGYMNFRRILAFHSSRKGGRLGGYVTVLWFPLAAVCLNERALRLLDHDVTGSFDRTLAHTRALVGETIADTLCQPFYPTILQLLDELFRACMQSDATASLHTTRGFFTRVNLMP